MSECECEILCLPGCGAVFGRADPDVLQGLGSFVFRDHEVKEDAPLDCLILKTKTPRSFDTPINTPATTQRHLQAALKLQTASGLLLSLFLIFRPG
jgi:hypothetical protein